jgi:hypothetical protein
VEREAPVKPVQFIPFYLMWIISGALSVACWMMLRAATVSVVALIERLVPMEQQIESGWYLRWAVRAADPCSLAVFSVFALASIVLFDFMYRTAIEKGTIKKVFFTVTGIQVGIIVVCALTLLITNLVAV